MNSVFAPAVRNNASLPIHSTEGILYIINLIIYIYIYILLI